jgi:predicted TIM-barrel enzyme
MVSPMKPNQLNSAEAVAALPDLPVLDVVHVYAMPGKEPAKLRWLREYAADKMLHAGVFKTHAAAMPGFDCYIVDSNGDQFFIQTA